MIKNLAIASLMVLFSQAAFSAPPGTQYIGTWQGTGIWTDTTGSSGVVTNTLIITATTMHEDFKYYDKDPSTGALTLDAQRTPPVFDYTYATAAGFAQNSNYFQTISWLKDPTTPVLIGNIYGADQAGFEVIPDFAGLGFSAYESYFLVDVNTFERNKIVMTHSAPAQGQADQIVSVIFTRVIDKRQN